MEEEHQIWYFFTTTLHIILAVKHTLDWLAHFWNNKEANQKPSKGENENITEKSITQSVEKIQIHDLHKKLYTRHTPNLSTPQTDEDNASKQIERKGEDQTKMKEEDEKRTAAWQCMVSSIVVVLMCRTLRSWNRTGDKWSHLPDVGDWLIRYMKQVFSIH